MRFEEKIPGGKLVAIEVLRRTKRTNDSAGDSESSGSGLLVKITGDFFLHPEDSLEDIERTLGKLPTDASEADVTAVLVALLSKSGATLIGVSACDLARIFKKATLKLS